MAIAVFPLVVLVIGLVLYFGLRNKADDASETRSKAIEVGKIAIFCGLLGLTLAYSHSTVAIGDSVQRR